jgi:site-specific recombinase XerD
MEARNFSRKTIETYTYALTNFSQYLARKGVKMAQKIRCEDLEQYQKSLRARSLAPTTIDLFMRTARAFLGWLEEQRELFVSPAHSMILPAPKRPLMPTPTRQDVLRMLSHPNTRTLTGVRDRALLETIYATGARVGELGSMSVQSVDLTESTIRLMGKGARERVVPLGKQAGKWIQQYLYRQGLVRPQLLQAFEYVKQPRVLPNSILTHAEMRALLESIPTDTSEGYRDRTLFELLYSSGIRAGEILGIQLTDLDLENQTVLVTGKGNKQRVVPIGNTATRFLTSYLAAVRPALEYNPQQQALFLDDTGQKMPYHTLRRILNHYTENAHLQTRVTLHTFRRSCTTEMVRAGANLYHIKEMLGHETLDTLKHYTKLTIVDLKKTHHQCHPREKENENE